MQKVIICVLDLTYTPCIDRDTYITTSYIDALIWETIWLPVPTRLFKAFNSRIV